MQPLIGSGAAAAAATRRFVLSVYFTADQEFTAAAASPRLASPRLAAATREATWGRVGPRGAAWGRVEPRGAPAQINVPQTCRAHHMPRCNARVLESWSQRAA